MLRFGVEASARGPFNAPPLLLSAGDGRVAGLRTAFFTTRGFVLGRGRGFIDAVLPAVVVPFGVAPAGAAGEALILEERREVR